MKKSRKRGGWEGKNISHNLICVLSQLQHSCLNDDAALSAGQSCVPVHPSWPNIGTVPANSHRRGATNSRVSPIICRDEIREQGWSHLPFLIIFWTGARAVSASCLECSCLSSSQEEGCFVFWVCACVCVLKGKCWGLGSRSWRAALLLFLISPVWCLFLSHSLIVGEKTSLPLPNGVSWLRASR